MTKLFQFVSEMQHAALKIKDHRIISRAMQYRFGNLIFENFLPRFKISNMVWFRHDLLRTYSGKVAMLTIYATSSDGKNSLTVLLSISDSASTGMYASVSN